MPIFYRELIQYIYWVLLTFTSKIDTDLNGLVLSKVKIDFRSHLIDEIDLVEKQLNANSLLTFYYWRIEQFSNLAKWVKEHNKLEGKAYITASKKQEALVFPHIHTLVGLRGRKIGYLMSSNSKYFVFYVWKVQLLFRYMKSNGESFLILCY